MQNALMFSQDWNVKDLNFDKLTEDCLDLGHCVTWLCGKWILEKVQALFIFTQVSTKNM